MIHNKPFDFTEYLQTILFEGYPTFFNGIDLNKQMILLVAAIEKLADLVGITTTTVLTITNLSFTYADPCSIYFEYSLTAGDTSVKMVKFSTPIFSGSYNEGYSIPMGTPPKPIYFYLTATIIDKEFGDGGADSNAICGIISDEHPTLVAGCKAKRYESVNIGVGSVIPANTIAILYTVTPYKIAGSWEFKVVENAPVYSGMPLENESVITENYFEGNNSITEYLIRIFKALKFGINPGEMIPIGETLAVNKILELKNFGSVIKLGITDKKQCYNRAAATLTDIETGEDDVIVTAESFSSWINTHENWRSPAYEQNWADLGVPDTQDLRFIRKGGICYIRGVCERNGSSLGTIFILPAGYRVASHIRTVCEADGNIETLVIANNGKVSIMSANSVVYINVSFVLN